MINLGMIKVWAPPTQRIGDYPTTGGPVGNPLPGQVVDIVGLYMAPPENAVVLCCDEKSQIQALNRTQKTLPLQPGHAEPPDAVQRGTHDYVRHGTTSLFAALEFATGKVTGVCKNRHRHTEFLAFVKHVARATPTSNCTW